MKLDVTLIDVSNKVPYWEVDDVDQCRDIRLIGAIQLKRNLFHAQSYRAAEHDLRKLELAADAVGNENVWGILAVTNVWYWKRGNQVNLVPTKAKENFHQLMNSITAARDSGYNLYFRGFHYGKSEETGKTVIVTEDTQADELDY